MGEPWKVVCELSATQEGHYQEDYLEVNTRKNFRDYLIQTPDGQMWALRPRVGGLLWEQSQQWLLLPPLLRLQRLQLPWGHPWLLRVSAAPHTLSPYLATGHLLQLLSLCA